MAHVGIHGPTHWERVRENGEYLAKHNAADTVVVRLFAYLHDCCRESDGADPDHGLRAAEYARHIRAELLSSLDGDQFELLTFACEHHEKGRVSRDPTVGACWDADRLDLGRVGRKPNPTYLSTDKAKTRAVIEWGWKRSRGHKATLKS